MKSGPFNQSCTSCFEPGHNLGFRHRAAGDRFHHPDGFHAITLKLMTVEPQKYEGGDQGSPFIPVYISMCLGNTNAIDIIGNKRVKMDSKPYGESVLTDQPKIAETLAT